MRKGIGSAARWYLVIQSTRWSRTGPADEANKITTGFFGRRDGYEVPLALDEGDRLDTHLGEWRPRAQRKVPTTWLAPSALLATRLALRRTHWSEPYQGADSLLGRMIARRSRKHNTHAVVYGYYWPGYLAGRGDAGCATLFMVHPHPGLIRRALGRARCEDPEFGHLSLEPEELWSADRAAAIDGALAAAQRVVCTSDFVAEGLRSLGPNLGRPFIIPYGVETASRLTRRPRAGPLRMLWLGQPTYRKGFFHLLRALKRLGAAAELRCIVRSKGILDDLNLPNSIDVWVDVGSTALPAHFKHADVFVMPSLAEGFGLAHLEAMAHGLPVVTTLRTGVGAVLRSGGGGLVVNPGDVDDLTLTLSELADHREQLMQMGLSALKSSREYTWSRFRRTILECGCS